MIDLQMPGPTIPQRIFRVVGHTGLPKLVGLYTKLGLLGDATPRQFECSFDGLRYRGRLDQRIDQHVYFFGSYSEAELDFLSQAASALRHRNPDIQFVDIGANVGQHTLFMAKRVSRILAFEPGKDAADQLETNIALNSLFNVTLSRTALGDQNGSAILGSGFPGNNGSRSLGWSLDAAQNSSVPVRRGDDALNDFGVARVDIIKIDVEGHERHVMGGLRKTLTTDRPVILFEMVGTEIKGGFRSELELRTHLYDDHVLYALGPGRRACLAPFSWSSEEAVCIPAELSSMFEGIRA